MTYIDNVIIVHDIKISNDDVIIVCKNTHFKELFPDILFKFPWCDYILAPAASPYYAV